MIYRGEGFMYTKVPARRRKANRDFELDDFSGRKRGNLKRRATSSGNMATANDGSTWMNILGRGNNGVSQPGKPVAKYSLDGELLAEYPSITLAAQAEQISPKGFLRL